MKRSELELFIMETYNAEADYPWLKYPNYEVFRHCYNRKWFALIMDVPKNKLGLQGEEVLEVVNFKCDPILIDSYDIYDEAGNTVYVVKGQLSWGHKLVIYDAYGNEVGMVVQKVLTFLPKFEIYKNGSYIGCLSKEFSFLTPHYNIDYNGWHIDGTIMEWDYSILNQSGYSIARVSKELFHMTDTYVIDVQDLGNALDVLMFVLAIDAEKCSRN